MFGTAAFTVAVGSLIGPVIESRMAAAVGQISASDLSLLEDHVVVLGYGEMTEPILEEIRDETDVVVVTEDAAVAADLKDEGINVLTDDPTDADALQDAEIGTARGVVVATHDDAQDVLAVLGAKRANPDVRVVAAATSQTHVDKLEQVGADDVISPTTIGGRVLGRSVLEGTATRSLFESWANGDADEDANEEE
ncbi:MAG: NAD(P)-binding protein [Haloferacaceae archaeon]